MHLVESLAYVRWLLLQPCLVMSRIWTFDFQILITLVATIFYR